MVWWPARIHFLQYVLLYFYSRQLVLVTFNFSSIVLTDQCCGLAVRDTRHSELLVNSFCSITLLTFTTNCECSWFAYICTKIAKFRSRNWGTKRSMQTVLHQLTSLGCTLRSLKIASTKWLLPKLRWRGLRCWSFSDFQPLNLMK